MVRNLDDFNKKGIKESNSTLPRSAQTRRKPELLSPTTLGSNFFELHPECGFAAEPIGLDSSDWNDDLTRYQFNSITSTSPSTTWLTHASPHFRQFRTQAEGKTTGYYQVPATELGYEANTCPKLMLLRVECDTTTVFGSAKSKRDPDTLSWDEAMSEDPESIKNWLASAKKEIEELEGKQAWEITDQSEAKNIKIIPGTWVFRRKRNPAGEITKWKARWVVRGDLQEVDFDTYAPVVAWSMVRIFMVLSLLLGWTMMALDFDNAFIQARLDDPVYTYLPRGFDALNPPPTWSR